MAASNPALYESALADDEALLNLASDPTANVDNANDSDRPSDWAAIPHDGNSDVFMRGGGVSFDCVGLRVESSPAAHPLQFSFLLPPSDLIENKALILQPAPDSFVVSDIVACRSLNGDGQSAVVAVAISAAASGGADRGSLAQSSLQDGSLSASDAIVLNWAMQLPAEQLMEPVVADADVGIAAQADTSLIHLDQFRADPRFAGIDGHGLSVVVIDTGIDLNHPFFGPDADHNGVDDRIVFSYDFSGSDDPDASDPFDPPLPGQGHGSNVASIIGSQDATFTGMAPGVSIIALKVFPDSGGGGNFGDVEQALQWVVANRAAYNVVSVNMSLGDGSNSNVPTPGTFLSDEIAALTSNSVAVVVASGNAYYNQQDLFNKHLQSTPQGVSFPSSDPNAWSVGAVWDRNASGPYNWSSGATDFTTGPDRIISFSQRSTTMSTIFAPGGQITGANATGSTVTFSGTSQASPHIAGLVADMQELAFQVSGHLMSVPSLKSTMISSAASIFDGDDENDNVTNTSAFYHRVDAEAWGIAILNQLFAGTAGNDTLNGTPVNDSISGQGGDDVIRGGGGDDTIDGGDGTDTAIFSGLRSAYSLVDLGGGRVRVSGPSADGTDTLTSVERLQFADQTVIWPLAAPTITSNGGGDTASVSISENSTLVTLVTATDPNAMPLAYSLSGGTDQAKFQIDPSSGALSFITPPDFENPTDSDHNNSYVVQVTASDGVLSKTQTITVNVANVNEAPTITSNGGGAAASLSIVQNLTAVTTVSATDPDAGTTLVYSIVGGVDQAKFQIIASTGALSFIAAPKFDFPTDSDHNNSYIVQVRASDGSLSDDQTVTVNVANFNEAPTIVSDGGNDTASLSVPENSAAVTTVSATDSNAGTTLVYSIAGGVDQAKFLINPSSGALSFITAPNFEAPADADHNNSYIVQVRASDGSLFDDQTLTVNVANVNEVPAIGSNGGGDTASVSIAENAVAVTTVNATDPDAGTVLVYSIVGGADQSKFLINASTGALAFKAAPDFENPADADHNNSYIVQVRASDGSLSDDQTLTVNVGNVNEVPAITSNGGGDTASVSIPENSTAVTTVSATDPDAGTTLTYSLVGGADQALFQIDAASGALSFAAAPDFEQPADADHNNSYIVQVGASDGALSDSQTITVNVTDVSDTFAILLNTLHPADLNGDHTDDMLWLNDDGRVATWLMSNAQVSSAPTIGSAPVGWTFTGSGDMNGDGKDDLLWLNADGRVAAWLVNGSQVSSAPTIGSAPVGWHLAGIADVNGDARDDILWRNDDGRMASWLVNNGQVTAAPTIGSAPVGWHFGGSGDLNGDGKDDLIWLNDDGRVAAWLVDGAQVTAAPTIGSAPAGWHFAGTADLNGDGKDDILWLNDDGRVASWLINNVQVASAPTIGSAPAGWHFAGTADVNGDHKTDILWGNDDGRLAAWLVDGDHVASAPTLGSTPGGWHIGDSHFDLV